MKMKTWFKSLFLIEQVQRGVECVNCEQTTVAAHTVFSVTN